MQISTPVLSTFILYVVIIYLIGFFSTRSLKNLSDFVLANRGLSGPVAALGAGASDMSGWLMMALPGAVLVYGLNQMWLVLGLTVGAYLNWQFVAKRIRVYTELANDSLTIPSYLNNRFPSSGDGMRLMTSIVIIMFFIFYAAAGFVSGALLTQSLFGMDYYTALWLSAIVMIIYTMIGGFVAVNWIDFFQGCLMFVSLLWVPWQTYNAIDLTHSNLNFTAYAEYFDVMSGFSWIGASSLLAWGLGYFGQPHILARFMAIRSHHEVSSARLIGMVWMILALYGALLTGLMGKWYFLEAQLAEPDMVFLELAKALFNPWCTGILMAAVLSAIMSSVTAQLLASSSALTEDVYHALFRKQAGDSELLLMSRVTVLLIAMVSLWLASDPSSRILNLVSYAWSGLGATFGPVIVMSLYWSRMTRQAALSGLGVSAMTVIVWNYFGQAYGGVFTLYAMIPACLFNFITIWMVSLMNKPPSQEMVNCFNQVSMVLKGTRS